MLWSRKPKNERKTPDYDDDDYDSSPDDFGGDDFDFGASDIKNKMSGRDVIKSAGAATIYEVKNKLTQPAEIVKMTKRALPKEYRQAFNAYDSTISEARGLYDSAVKEAKPLIKVLKKTVSKVTPAIDTVLPKSVAEKIKNWTVDTDTSYNAPSKEEQRNLAMNAELADFMQVQIKTNASERAEDIGKETVKNTIENMRHKDVVGNLSDINRATVTMSAFHENLTAKYYHKQLSIGLRQIYLLTDIMEENKKLTALSTTSFEAITKNTSLPEFQKLQMSERFKGLAQNKFMSSLGNSANRTLFDAQDGVFGDFVTNLKKNTQSLIRDKINTYKDMLDQALQADEMMSEAASSGMGSKEEMAADMGGAMVGGLIADPIQDRVVKHLAKFINKNKKIVKLGHQIDYNSRNMGQFVKELFSNIEEKDIPVISKVFGFANESMGRAKYDNKLHVDKFGKNSDNINAPITAFTERFSRSVTDVIPGLLSRMFRELRIIRTGNVESELIEYNFLSNKFTDTLEIKKDIYNEIFDSEQTKSLNNAGNEMIKKIDPDGDKFTDEERDELMRFLLHEKIKGTYINKEFLTDENSYRGKNSDKFANTFKNMIEGDKTESKINEFDKSLNEFGRRVFDKRSFLQSVVNSGKGDVLIELGLIDKKGYIDMKKLYSMILDGGDPDVLLKSYEDSEKNNKPLNIKRSSGPITEVASQDVNYLSPETDNRITRKNISNNAELTKETNACKCEEQFNKLIESTNGILNHLKETSYKEKIESIDGSINEIKELVAGINNINTDGRWYNKSIGANFKNLVGAGTGLLGGAKDVIKGGFGKAKNLGGAIMDRTTEWIDTIKDIKMTGFPEFTMTAMKLRAGHYVDAVTGKVITKFEDIKGDIKDITTNEIVLLYADIGKLYYVDTGNKIKRLFNKGIKKAKLFGFRRYRDLLNLPKKIKEFTNKTIGKAYTLILDAPCDIYIRKKESPDILTKVMLQKKMENGGYFSALTKKAITRPSMIDGAVIDEIGKEVITTEDVLAGLYNENGKPIKTGFKKVFDGIKGAGKFIGKGIGKVWEFGKEKLGNAWDFVKGGAKSLFGKAFGVDGFIQVNGKKTTDLLTKIFNVLDDRLPGGKKKKEAHHIRGSENHDRAGSFESQQGENGKSGKFKDKAKEKGSEYFDKFKDKIKGFGKSGMAWGAAAGAGASSKLQSVKDNTKEEVEKRKEDKEKKNEEGMNPTLSGGLGAAAGMAAWGVIKWALGGALRGAGSLLGWALGATGWTLGTVATAGLSVATSVLSGAVALLSSPVVLGAAAIAGVAYGGYKAYQYFSKVKMTNLNKLRCIQYGIDPDIDEKTGILFDLENKLEEHVKLDGGGKPSLDLSKIDLKELAIPFGAKKGDLESIARWSDWFVRRFRPVFLNSIAARNLINVKDKLTDIDDLDPKQKLEYFSYASFRDGPYNELSNPFGKKRLQINKEFVIGWIDYIGKKLEEKTTAGDRATIAEKVSSKENPYQKKSPNEIKKEPNQPDMNGKETARVNEDTQPKFGENIKDTGKIISISSNNDEGVDTVDKLDPLTAIRMKTYGLVDLNVEKVRSLLKLEFAVLKQVTFDNGVATWRGNIDSMVMGNASYFGVIGVRNNDADNWRFWFVNRFLTTFMGFLSGLAKNTSSIGTSIAVSNNVLATIVRALSTEKMIDVAFATYSVTYGGVIGKKEGGASVWNITQSPWPGYILNKNIKSIDGNMEYLRKSGKKTVIPEATTKESVVTEKKTETETNTNPNAVNNPNKPSTESSSGFFGTITNGIKNTFNSVKETVNNVKETVSKAVDAGAYKLGIIDSPGHGTKGDINSLPVPLGKNNYASYKDLIDKASAMTGVDPNVMAVMAAIESSFNNDAKPGTSSAKGLYQFTDDTWRRYLKKCGHLYGLGANTSVYDARANTLMGAELLKDNYRDISRIVKRPLTAADLYAGHMLGLPQVTKFYKAADTDIAAQVIPDAAASNLPTFYKDGKKKQQPRTIGEVKQLYAGLVVRRAKEFKIAGNYGDAAVAAPTAGTPNTAPTNTATPTTTQTPTNPTTNAPKSPMATVAQGGGTASTEPTLTASNRNNPTAPTKENATKLLTTDNGSTIPPKTPTVPVAETKKTASIAPSPLTKPKSEAETRKIANTPKPEVTQTAPAPSDGNTIGTKGYDLPLPNRLGLTVSKQAPMVSKPTETSKAFDTYFSDNTSLSKQQLSSLEIQNIEMKKQTELLNLIANNLSSKGTTPDVQSTTRGRDVGNSKTDLPTPLVALNRSY